MVPPLQLRLSKEDKQEENGFPPPYQMSKIAIIALAKIQQRELQADSRPDLIVNSCCPGLVATDMVCTLLSEYGNLKPGDYLGGFLKPEFKVKDIDEGADTVVYLALLPPNTKEPKGQFVAERQINERQWNMAKVAIVTGGNKGIGYATVKGLAKQIKGYVYLTARNETLGQEAVESLKKELGSPNGDKIHFHQLDVTKIHSITSFRDYLIKAHDGIDILVSNAGIYPKPDGTLTLEQQSELAVRTNYYGLKNVSEELFPLLNPHARVVVVASRDGALRGLEDTELQKKFLNENLTVQEIEGILHQYIQLSKEGKQEGKGFPAPYHMSKIAVIGLAKIQQREFQADSRPDLIINSCCPGLVATNMTSTFLSDYGNLKVGDYLTPEFKVKDIDEGADTLIYLALLPPNAKEPKGEFVAERKVLEWEKLPSTKDFDDAMKRKQQEKEENQ